MADILLHKISQKELEDWFREVLKEELRTFFLKDKKSDDRLLTRTEVASMLHVSLPSLHKYTLNGTIKAVRIGNSVRYKMEAVEHAMQNIQSIKHQRR